MNPERDGGYSKTHTERGCCSATVFMLEQPEARTRCYISPMWTLLFSGQIYIVLGYTHNSSITANGTTNNVSLNTQTDTLQTKTF